MSRTILVVDDSATLRAAVSDTLTKSGYTVHEAVNGQEGLGFLEQARAKGLTIDMIISDINMPVMGGIEFIRNVKQGPDKFIPVLILTTERDDQMKMQGRQVGAAGWLVKPFQPPVLAKVVRKFVR